MTKAKRKFSRKTSGRYAARINLRWRGEDGKWRSRSLVQVSDSLEKAIDALLLEDEINSLTYEVPDGFGGTETVKIHSKTKKIVGVSLDKYVTRKRKVSKASRKKAVKKKSRRRRH